MDAFKKDSKRKPKREKNFKKYKDIIRDIRIYWGGYIPVQGGYIGMRTGYKGVLLATLKWGLATTLCRLATLA